MRGGRLWGQPGEGRAVVAGSVEAVTSGLMNDSAPAAR